MIKIIEDVIASNELSVWLTAIGVAAALFFLVSLARRIVVRRLRAVAARTSNEIDDLVVAVLSKTGKLFFLLISLYTGAHFLSLGAQATRLLDTILVLGFLLQGGLWGSGAIAFWLTLLRSKREGDSGGIASIGILGLGLRVVLWSVVLLLGLDNLGVNITGLVAGLGISGIAVALAVQNILGDLFASLSIVLDKPFEIGDFIIVDQHLGSVEYIGWKSTRIRSLSGEQIVISNSDLLRSRIRNYKRMAERRVLFTVGTTYDTPSGKVEAVPGMLREAVEGQTDTRFDRAHFKEFGDSALIFECVYHVLTPDYNRYMDIQQEINLTLLRRFEKEKIEFAFPTRTVHVKTEQEPTWPVSRRGGRKRT